MPRSSLNAYNGPPVTHDFGVRCNCKHYVFVHQGGFGPCEAHKCQCKAASHFDLIGAKWSK